MKHHRKGNNHEIHSLLEEEEEINLITNRELKEL